MATTSHTKTSSFGWALALLRPCSKSHQPKDAALIESPRRIPLSDSAQRAQRKLQLACVCSVFFMVAEVVGGFLAGSLAIMADAAHLLTDVAAFCISLFAIWMSTRPATNRLSYGFQRTEVIGAVTSVLVLWVLTGVLVYAAVIRFIECLKPNPTAYVDGKLMFIVACIGLLVNLVLMQILGHGHSHGGGAHGHSHNGAGSHGHSHGHGHSDKEHDHVDEIHDHTHDIELLDVDSSDNGGIYHCLSPQSHGHSHGERRSHRHDHGHVKQSSGTDLEAGQGKSKAKKAWRTSISGRHIFTPWVTSFRVSAFASLAESFGSNRNGRLQTDRDVHLLDTGIVYDVGIVRDSVHILMEGSPEGIDTKEIELGLRGCWSVVGVHDLHIWSLSAGLPSLSVHIVAEDVEAALHSTQRYPLEGYHA
ncbi:hypothetical protein AM588_10001075 [Phytophthora nicotianae]|uniref:Cation efflux protein transmembrane domain-containing protein n=1 Tax=Phytophthora nicotianae TaxID=4792 RepID=A0A0W8CP10_PHYNI|nr:hypothetical protein AM588_10001075 [Phytophthora nicotianae]